MKNLETDNRETAQPGAGGILNVLLHGAFALIQERRAKQILALVPDIDHHVCRAGSWLAETELEDGRDYELLGVATGDGTFQPERNLIVKSRNWSKSGSRSTLKFPCPKEITSLRVGDIPYASFDHAEELASDGKMQHVATLHVLTYDITDENNLCLKASEGSGHYWEPVCAGRYVNLHVFSAEDHFEEPSHATADFRKCVGLLGLHLGLNRNLLASEIAGDNELPPGVAAEETEDLAPRTLRMAQLGRLVTGGGNANLAWFGNDALDGDPEACGGPVMFGD